MADEEEYAIVSKKEFLALKKELDRLKQNPLEGSEHGETLQASIDNLNKSLNVMLEVFKQAAEDMKLDEHDSQMIAKQMGPINEKLDKLVDQNQKIAKGIVAVADMIKEKLEDLESSHKRLPPLKPLGPLPSPSAPPSPAPGIPSPSAPGMVPPPLGASKPGQGDLPPLGPPGASANGPGASSGSVPPAPGAPLSPPSGLPPMPDIPPLGSAPVGNSPAGIPPSPGNPPGAPPAPGAVPGKNPAGAPPAPGTPSAKDLMQGLMK